MEDNYETNEESVDAKEFLDYLERHPAEEITAGVDEFLGHVKHLCRSMSALYMEYKFQNLAMGICVTVDMHIAAIGKTERISTIGLTPMAEKFLKEGKDGGE